MEDTQLPHSAAQGARMKPEHLRCAILPFNPSLCMLQGFLYVSRDDIKTPIPSYLTNYILFPLNMKVKSV